MKVLIVGGNGSMGPRVLAALRGRHELRVTDVKKPPPDFAHEYVRLDAGDHDGVTAAAEGMDAIINLSVSRWERRGAWDVNVRGNYNVASAAVRHGIRTIVNTGPLLPGGRSRRTTSSTSACTRTCRRSRARSCTP